MIIYRQDLVNICDQNNYSNFFNNDCRTIIEKLEERLEAPVYIIEDNEEFILPVIDKYLQERSDENFYININPDVPESSIFYRKLLLNEKQFKGLIFSLSIDDKIQIYEEETYKKIKIPKYYKEIKGIPYNLDKVYQCFEVYISITKFITEYPISFTRLSVALGIEQYAFFNQQNTDHLFNFPKTIDKWHMNSTKMMDIFQSYITENLTYDQRSRIIIWGSIVLYGSGAGYPDDIDFIVDCKGEFSYDFIIKMQKYLSKDIPKIDAGIMIKNDLVLRGDKNFKPDTPENTSKTVYQTPQLTGAKDLEYLIENPRFHHVVLGLKTVSTINTLKRYFVRGSPKDLTKIIMSQNILGITIGDNFCLSLHDKFGRSYFYKEKFLSISRLIMEQWYGFSMTNEEMNKSFPYCKPRNGILNTKKNNFLDTFINKNSNKYFNGEVIIIGNSEEELDNFHLKEQSNIEFVTLEDFNQINYPGGSFDTVLLFFSICMESNRDFLLGKCYKILSKRGKIIIMMFDGSYIKNNIKKPKLINRTNMRDDEYTKLEDEINNKYSVPNIAINYPNSDNKFRVEFIDKKTDLFNGSPQNPGIAVFYTHMISRIQYLVYPGNVSRICEKIGFRNINPPNKSKKGSVNFDDCFSLILCEKV